MVRVSLRTIVMDVPPQDIITRDNVSVKVNAVVYFRVMDPRKAIVEVESYHYATSQLAQTTLRSVLGQVELDDLLSERERLNAQLQQILDQHTEPWGVKVSSVEVKQVDLPPDMQRAMAKQAEAEREKRAKIIHAAGELEASQKLAQAATAMAVEPMTITLRYLQTLTEIASEKNSTIIFPLPIELLNLLQARQINDKASACPTPTNWQTTASTRSSSSGSSSSSCSCSRPAWRSRSFCAVCRSAATSSPIASR